MEPLLGSGRRHGCVGNADGSEYDMVSIDCSVWKWLTNSGTYLRLIRIYIATRGRDIAKTGGVALTPLGRGRPMIS